MIKVRIEGKEKEIKNYIEKLKKDEQIEIYNISDIVHKKEEISLYWRCFLEIEVVNDKENEVIVNG